MYMYLIYIEHISVFLFQTLSKLMRDWGIPRHDVTPDLDIESVSHLKLVITDLQMILGRQSKDAPAESNIAKHVIQYFTAFFDDLQVMSSCHLFAYIRTLFCLLACQSIVTVRMIDMYLYM